MKFVFIVVIFLTGSDLVSQSADTVKLDLNSAENTFLSKNLLLLAAKYDIATQEAYQIQARLLDNPYFYFEQSVYNNLSKKYFPTKTRYSDGSLGQNQMSISQLVSIAGKRNKRAKLAKINTEVARYQFYDLLRTLRYSLASNFYYLNSDLRSYQLYTQQIDLLSKTISVLKEQSEKGNISVSEYLRLLAFQNNLKKEQLELFKSINEQNREMHVLLADSSLTIYSPIVDSKKADDVNLVQYTIKQLIDTANGNRADLKINEALIKYENQNLEYQRSLSVPDLNLQGTYDRNGSYIPNYYGVGVGLPIVIFNRNQGNVKAARSRIKEAEANSANSKLQIESEVLVAYQNALQLDKLYKTTDKAIQTQYETLLLGITSNYNKRNISIVEFLDYYESFKNNLVQINLLKADFFNAIENLNYTVGKNLIK